MINEIIKNEFDRKINDHQKTEFSENSWEFFSRLGLSGFYLSFWMFGLFSFFPERFCLIKAFSFFIFSIFHLEKKFLGGKNWKKNSHEKF